MVCLKQSVKKILVFCLFCLSSAGLFSQAANDIQNSKETESSENTKETQGQKLVFTEKQLAMQIKASDIQIVPDEENGGYHLYVKKLPGINSILLTETTRDPSGKAANYAYRALEYNSINGDEIRYLDGKPLVSEGAKYSLVDSTPESHAAFGQAFHIYIPSKIRYGYEWSRNAIIEVGKGTFINIRTFEKPYADYTGDYMDSPFMFNLETRRIKKPKKNPPEPEPEPEPMILTDDYNPVASQIFQEISDGIIYSKGPETIIEDIKKILDDMDKSGPVDVVFAIDATGSMKNDIETLKKDMQAMLETTFAGCSDYKVGLLFYRDYGDGWNYRGLPVRVYGFTSSFVQFTKNLNAIRIFGTEGGDIPEAVYEAIYSSVSFFKWREEAVKKIILIGDAEPHPTPRGTGKYSKDYVMLSAEEKDISVTSILLPND